MRLAEMIMQIAGKRLRMRRIPGPLGVRGRDSDNRLIAEKLGWKPSHPLSEDLEKTYNRVAELVKSKQVHLLRIKQGGAYLQDKLGSKRTGLRTYFFPIGSATRLLIWLLST